MTVSLSDDEGFDHESESDQERNFVAFTATVVVSKAEIVEENPSDGELPDMLTCKKYITRFARL